MGMSVATRRQVMLGLAALPAFAGAAVRADQVVDLTWPDLLPRGQTTPAAPLVQHDAPLVSQQPASSGIRSEWNGQIVRLPGFVVPLDYDGTEVTLFLLVPYVGACVHVPPPPANQLVLVSTQIPFESKSLFAPVHVTGMFGAAATSTQLADVGYALSADLITPYRDE